VSERDFSASGYTVLDRRNALLPMKSKYDDGSLAI
jgi:hypothetical protein